MGCGASTNSRVAPAPKASAAERKELRSFLTGIGVREVEKTALALEKCGIFKRRDLTMLDEKLMEEVSSELSAAGVTIGDRGKVKNVKGQEVVVKNPNGGYTAVVDMQPGQAVQCASKLERVFLGLGWTNKSSGGTVDVDASCVAYSHGVMVESVNFTNLRNDSKSIVHTGDILHGDSPKKESLEDLERIYVWLKKVPSSIDCVVLCANIYSGASDFKELKDAYVRCVNADTNQEISRLRLGGKGLRGNAVVFVKLYRADDTWQMMGMGMPLDVPGCSGVNKMYPVLEDKGCIYPPPACIKGGKECPPKAKKQKPSMVLPCVALAVGTTAGIAAATAIFLYQDQLSLDALDPTNFVADFGALECVGDALSGATDLLPMDEVGDVFSWAADVTSGVDIDGFGEAAGGALLGSADFFGDVAGGAGDAFGGLADGAGDIASGAGGFFGGIGDMFEGMAGGLAEAAGGLADAAGGLADAAGGMAEAAGGLAEGGGAVLSGAAEVGGGLLSALS